MTTKIERRIKIKYRVRNKVSGTTERPRMSVFRSNKQIYVQISTICLVRHWLLPLHWV